MYKEQYSKRVAEILDNDLITNLIGIPIEYIPLTRKEKMLRWFKRLPQYLTRYKIVDTWHIHDDCGDY